MHVQFNEDVLIEADNFSLTSADGSPNYPLDASFNGDGGEPQDGGGLDYEFDAQTAVATATFRLASPFTAHDQVVLRLKGTADSNGFGVTGPG